MTKLPNKEFRAMVPLLREEGFYEHEEPRKIYWPKYNEAQIKDAKETLEFIRDKVDECNNHKIGFQDVARQNFLILIPILNSLW